MGSQLSSTKNVASKHATKIAEYKKELKDMNRDHEQEMESLREATRKQSDVGTQELLFEEKRLYDKSKEKIEKKHLREIKIIEKNLLKEISKGQKLIERRIIDKKLEEEKIKEISKNLFIVQEEGEKERIKQETAAAKVKKILETKEIALNRMTTLKEEVMSRAEKFKKKLQSIEKLNEEKQKNTIKVENNHQLMLTKITMNMETAIKEKKEIIVKMKETTLSTEKKQMNINALEKLRNEHIVELEEKRKQHQLASATATSATVKETQQDHMSVTKLLKEKQTREMMELKKSHEKKMRTMTEASNEETKKRLASAQVEHEKAKKKVVDELKVVSKKLTEQK